MQLSRVVPKHTRTERFHWVRLEFMKFATYREARVRMGMSVQSKCYWCQTTFDYDAMLALAAPEKGRNKLLCPDCGKSLQDSSQGERDGR